MSTFNGWTNYATWNVALWMGNKESLNTLARRIAAGGGTYRDLDEVLVHTSKLLNEILEEPRLPNSSNEHVLLNFKARKFKDSCKNSLAAHIENWTKKSNHCS